MPRATDTDGWNSELSRFGVSPKQVMEFFEKAKLTPAIRARYKRITKKSDPTDHELAWLAGVCAPGLPLSSYLFLDACRRLKISPALIDRNIFPDSPKWLPRHATPGANSVVQMPSFTPPAWDVLQQSEDEYRKHLGFRLDAIVEGARLSMEQDGWTFIAAPVAAIAHRAGNIPLEVRYEWAAERLCLKRQFKDIAESAAVKYPKLFRIGMSFEARTDKVKSAVLPVLAQFPLADGT